MKRKVNVKTVHCVLLFLILVFCFRDIVSYPFSTVNRLFAFCEKIQRFLMQTDKNTASSAILSSIQMDCPTFHLIPLDRSDKSSISIGS